MRLRLRVWICGISAVLLVPCLTAAQSSATGSLSGTVSDPERRRSPGRHGIATNPVGGARRRWPEEGGGRGWPPSRLAGYSLSFE